MLSQKMSCDISCTEQNGGLLIGSLELYFPCTEEDFWSVVEVAEKRT